jgi:hypothetical protein
VGVNPTHYLYLAPTRLCLWDMQKVHRKGTAKRRDEAALDLHNTMVVPSIDETLQVTLGPVQHP